MSSHFIDFIDSARLSDWPSKRQNKEKNTGPLPANPLHRVPTRNDRPFIKRQVQVQKFKLRIFNNLSRNEKKRSPFYNSIVFEYLTHYFSAFLGKKLNYASGSYMFSFLQMFFNSTDKAKVTLNISVSFLEIATIT